MFDFRPALLTALQKGYSRKTFFKDLSAGLIVGIVAIPLAVAFGIASGVRPDVGLLTAVIGGLVISALGGSQVQIGGPTGAFIVIVYGVISQYGPEGLIIATLMAGLMLLILGFGRLGTVIQFIPFPVIIGFTSGIAVIIFSSQVNDFLGLGLSGIPADFLGKWELYLSQLSRTNPWALGISLGTILVILLVGRISKKLPAALVALAGFTLLVQFLGNPVLGWNIQTIGSRFGEISGSIPWPSLPALSLEKIQGLLLPAVSIAILAGIESLLSAVVADGMTGQKHHSNTELAAQGFANIASALFGGIPVTGAIARTATNIKNGGQTPVAGIIHGVFLLGVLLFLSPLTGLIPLPVLAGILATVAYNMSEHHTFRLLLKGPRGDILALLVTFFLTVLVDLTVAIPVGILLVLLSFLQKMSGGNQVTIHRESFQEASPELDPFGLTQVSVPEGTEVVEVSGPLFFGGAQRVKEDLAAESPPKVRILRLRQVPSLDSSGAMVLRDLVKESRRKGYSLLVTGLQPGVFQVMEKIGLTEEIGGENILPFLPQALDRARQILGQGETPFSQQISQGTVTLLDTPRRNGPGDSRDLIKSSVAFLPVPESLQPHLIQSLLEREELASTAMGRGLAFPHPRNPVLPEEIPESVSLVYLDPPMDWGASDGEKVHTAVFILSHTVQSHLKTLAKFTKLARNPEFLEWLRSHPGKEALLQVADQSLNK